MSEAAFVKGKVTLTNSNGVSWKAHVCVSPPGVLMHEDGTPISKFDWMPAPTRTEWGGGMVVTDVAIDKNHTLSIYVEAREAHNVEAALRRALEE